MSECVVRMEMPENCCECQLRQEDYEMGEEFCPFTGVECLSIGRQNNCPIICQLPEGHGRLVESNQVAKMIDRWTGYLDEDMIYRIKLALNRDVPTIVPAERSET